MPRWTFCTSPANVNRVMVGSGGKIPKKTAQPNNGSTRPGVRQQDYGLEYSRLERAGSGDHQLTDYIPRF